MGMHFSLPLTSCSVKQVLNNTEKHGDEDLVVGQIVALGVTVDVSVLNQMALDKAHVPLWEAFLFDDDKAPAPNQIKPIQFVREFEDHTVSFAYSLAGKITTRKVKEAKLKKFKIEPVFPNSVVMSFQIHMHPQSPDTMGWMVNMLTHDATIEIEPPAQSDAFEDPAPKKPASKTKKNKGANGGAERGEIDGDDPPAMTA